MSQVVFIESNWVLSMSVCTFINANLVRVCICVGMILCFDTHNTRTHAKCVLALCKCPEIGFLAPPEVVGCVSVFWTQEAAPTSVHKVKYILAEIHTGLCVWTPAEQMLQ